MACPWVVCPHLTCACRPTHPTRPRPPPPQDDAARVANQEYVEAMKKLEIAFEQRNTDAANWTRFGLQGGTAAPLPYTLLMPGSKAGVTMRGVPYSVSI